MANLRKYAPFFLMVALILALAFSAGSAEASARTANWVVSVTYQNVGDAPATLVVNFYEEGSSTPVAYDPLNGGTLAPGAGRSFFIGRVTGLSDGFKGNAVISSDQPLVSTVVQFSQDPGFRMRLLSNGMQSSDTSDQYLIATVLKNRFQRTTVFSIQNTEAESIEATVRFYDADNSGALASTVVHTIPAYSSKYIEMDVQVDTGIAAATFNGSAIVTAVKASDDSPAQIVGAASELYVDRNVAANFEGVPYSRAANTINMATGLCESFGLDTFYAVSNASLSDSASITVNYFNTNGSAAGTDGPYNIGAGQKRSIRTCDAVSSGFTGSGCCDQHWCADRCHWQGPELDQRRHGGHPERIHRLPRRGWWCFRAGHPVRSLGEQHRLLRREQPWRETACLHRRPEFGSFPDPGGCQVL
jgi:hypothetical protein